MLHAGLDLSRKRLDYCLITGQGEVVDVGAVSPDAGGLNGFARKVELRHGPVEVVAAIELDLTRSGGHVGAGLRSLLVDHL
jgi:hypothetical protein